ncbi:hypothetical protein TTHT_0583 [Thermotomaculum hydrothermale]|uniref:Lipoprotein n=1 Tax=Thermotomaculum hydrothermale TaxID=981385 RepID=A0A7R6PL83_9BACT|nr:hypothetical protein [Thermotomaculum hydrothermale]BBB32167.1 hypothetical protein TTHT_0583 [Thermotomaculum hydrothermale]
MRKLGFILVLISIFSISCKVHLSKYDKKCKKTNTFIFLFNKTVKYPLKLIVDGKEIPIIHKKGDKLYIYNLKDGEHEIDFISDFYIFNRPVKRIKKGKGLLCYQVVLVTKYPKDFYKDKLKKPPIGKRIVNFFKFWKSRKEEKQINKNEVYAVLKD